jgi:hypothetical protein
LANEEQIIERPDIIEKNQILKWEVDDLRYVNGKEKRKIDSYLTKVTTFIIASLSIGLALWQSESLKSYSAIAFNCALALLTTSIIFVPIYYWFSKNLLTTEQMAI